MPGRFVKLIDGKVCRNRETLPWHSAFVLRWMWLVNQFVRWDVWEMDEEWTCSRYEEDRLILTVPTRWMLAICERAYFLMRPLRVEHFGGAVTTYCRSRSRWNAERHLWMSVNIETGEDE